MVAKATQNLFDVSVGGAGFHFTSHLIALVALFIACFAIAGYVMFRNDSIPASALKDQDADFEDITADSLTLSGDLQTKGLVYGASYKTVESVTADNVITASEAGSLFIINDHDNTSTLPTATDALIGAKFKFVISDTDATGITIQGSDTNQCFYGSAVISKEATPSTLFVQDTGGSNSSLALDGTTTGGIVTGTAGNTSPLNVIECTCVRAAVSGTDTDCWYIEAQLTGSGELGTPFAVI